MRQPDGASALTAAALVVVALLVLTNIIRGDPERIAEGLVVVAGIALTLVALLAVNNR